MSSLFPRAAIAATRVCLAAFSGLLLGVGLARSAAAPAVAALGLLVATGFLTRDQPPWLSVVAGMAAANALTTSHAATDVLALLLAGISTDLLGIYSRWMWAQTRRPITRRPPHPGGPA